MVVYGSRRERISLGHEIGGGGEATVYRVVDRPDLLAKVYKPRPRLGYDKKLTWMRDNPPDDPTRALGHTSIAWPLDLLHNAQGQFVGYSMHYIRNAVPLLEVFNPRLRARTLPGFDWRYLHRTSRNVAVALAALHTCGYVVGDLNESNVMVTPSAMVTLIDTDSFQVRTRNGGKFVTYFCPVGKPEYTPPELQGRSLRHTRQHAEHDCFGLGVLIFQLLMGGSHPFRAQWLGEGDPPPIEKKIRQGAFPYMKSPSLPVAPPRNAPPLEALHPRVAELVRRCFIAGHSSPQQRPTSREWEIAISEAEKALIQCPNGHFFSKHLRACHSCGAERGGMWLRLGFPRRTTAQHAPARPTASSSPVAPSPVPQPSVRQRWGSASRAAVAAVASLPDTVSNGLRNAVSRLTGGVMGGAIVGAYVWAAGGAVLGAFGGTLAAVLGQPIIWVLAWAIIWASGWWAFGEVLGETMGGRGLGRGVGVGGGIAGALLGGGLGWFIGQKGIEEISNWVVVSLFLDVIGLAVSREAFEGIVGAALVGMAGGAFVWAATWAIAGAIGGGIGWRTAGGRTLTEALGRVPNKALGTVWALAGAVEGATAGAIFGVVVGAIVGGIVGIMGGAVGEAPVIAVLGAIIGAIIGAMGGNVGVEYVEGVGKRLGKAFAIVEAIVGLIAGLMVARGGLDLWANGVTGGSAILEGALVGVVSGALIGLISGALVGSVFGAVARAADV